MTFSGTVQQLIDAARIRHWAFAQLTGGDGAALLYLNQRLRTHLAMHGAAIDGLVGTAMSYDLATFNGLLVAESLGVPVYSTTYADGWPVHDDGTGVPTVDFTEPPIAVDPFGASGGTPGFPLPADMIRLIAVSLVSSNPQGVVYPCDVIRETARFTTLPGRNPSAFVSGNRLVPNMPFTPSSANSADRWFSVASIQISYVAVQTLSTLADYLNIPVVLAEALIADIACYFAYQSKALSASDKKDFAQQAQEIAAQISAASLDLLNDAESQTVQYNG